MSFGHRDLPSMNEVVAFATAARLGSFTLAAERLAITQSAVSKRIQQLEETLGVALFERGGGKLSITRAGQIYLKTAEEAIGLFRSGALAVGARGRDKTVLKVVSPPSFALSWLTPRLPRFRTAHDSLVVNLSTRVQPDDLYGESFDVSIHYGAAGWTHPDASLLCEEEFVPVASPGYLSQTQLRTEADLVDAVLLQHADRPRLWKDWFGAARISGQPGRGGPIFDRFPLTVSAALAGMGIALVSPFMIEDELESGRLVMLSGHVLNGPGAYHAVVPRSKQRPATLLFRKWLMAEAARGARTRHPAYFAQFVA